MDALSYALIKLYDEVTKPNDPIAFIRQHFRAGDQEATLNISDYEKIEDLNASELIKKLERELKMAQHEISVLRSTLEEMSANT